MMKATVGRPIFVNFCVLFALIFVLSGCQNLPKIRSNYEYFHLTQDWDDRDPKKSCKDNTEENYRGWNRCIVEIARTSFHYAQMADVVYYGESELCGNFNEEIRQFENFEYHTPRCEDKLTNKNGRYKDRKFVLSDRFKHLDREIKRSGLVYDLYQDTHAYRDVQNKMGECSLLDICEVVIVFRGTNFDRWEDWLHGNIGERQRYQALATYDLVKQKYPDASIIVAGHSLGGALAMQVSLCRDVRAAFTFDGSPRFRNSMCDKSRYKNNNFQVIEKGEILRLLRVAKILGDANPSAWTEIDCRQRGNPLNNHSMVELAGCLTVIAASEHSEADSRKESVLLRDEARQAILRSDMCRDLDGIHNKNLGTFHNGSPNRDCFTGGAENWRHIFGDIWLEKDFF